MKASTKKWKVETRLTTVFGTAGSSVRGCGGGPPVGRLDVVVASAAKLAQMRCAVSAQGFTELRSTERPTALGDGSVHGLIGPGGGERWRRKGAVLTIAPQKAGCDGSLKRTGQPSLSAVQAHWGRVMPTFTHGSRPTRVASWGVKVVGLGPVRRKGVATPIFAPSVDVLGRRPTEGVQGDAFVTPMRAACGAHGARAVS